ncbi:CsgG/HfaB family protein [Croceiramulus getboli]|nr:CsgG/HfaB family protein [Flavobacteriaceae bacterium YJPT1-3]
MSQLYRLGIFSLLFTLSACGAFFNQPFQQQEARIGETTGNGDLLKSLPEATEPVYVAVYNFRDQTGQYKAVENGSTFSTAVTQGSTTILIKALEDSKWFKPVERENLSNLSTERNIIRNTTEEYIKNRNPNVPPLPALKFAGMILEGGIISYDTNIITGGAGARYFGAGGSARYRQDRITIYLRAVSTNSGEILNTVYVSKTILSQAIDANFFRFVKFQRLLEAETGVTQNEPVQLAVQDAIEAAVYSLIMEGIEDGLWSAKGGREVNNELVSTYNLEKSVDQSTRLFEREFMEAKYKNSFDFSLGATLLDADFSKKGIGPMAKIGYTRQLNKFLGINLNAGIMQFRTGTSYENFFGSADLNAVIKLLPNDTFAPYIYAGGGIIVDGTYSDDNVLGISSESTDAKFQYGAGVEYMLNDRLGFRAYAEHNVTINDQLDKLVNGKRDDYYFNFGVGLNYYFGLKDKPQQQPGEVAVETIQQ